MMNTWENEPVAIVGLACRLPGDAVSVDGFWDSLIKGKSAVSQIPKDRWNSNGYYNADNKQLNTSITNKAHFLNSDISAFDANFFSISHSEALSMDPQQRLMLEVAFEAFENAGASMEKLAQCQIGCWVSSFSQDWKEMQFSDIDTAPKYAMSGMQPELLSNRISHFFDLRGPSITIATACSGSLVGLHMACQSLRSGECDSALVGGANLLLSPNMFIALSNQGFLAPDGICKAFDASANGYGRGEGFAALVLKPLSKAIGDNDQIRAIIRGTGTGQDGRTRGLTMPNGDAQETLIKSTYRAAGLDMKDTAYFEAHGTGTQVGDFEELGAISRTIAKARLENGLPPLLVGSAKTNIGHLEAVAGLVGVIKAVLILENAKIPPNLHFHYPNPRIPFQEWHISIPTQISSWQQHGIRRISVNSFGFGGSNAHAILDDAEQFLTQRQANKMPSIGDVNGLIDVDAKPAPLSISVPCLDIQDDGFLKVDENIARQRPISCSDAESYVEHKIKSFVSSDDTEPTQTDTLKVSQLIMLSSADQEGLVRQKDGICRYLEQKGRKLDSTNLLNRLVYTLNHKRSHLLWRTHLVASTLDDLKAKLQSNIFSALRSSILKPRIAFIFTGQGAQWARMGIEMFRYTVFRQSINAAQDHLTNIGCPWSIVDELHRDASTSNIHNPWYSQTLCTVMQVALVELLTSWNITPHTVVGHSSGEICAAYATGALSRKDAWTIAYWRGKLSSEMGSIAPDLKGGMMAVGASQEQTQAWVNQLTNGQCVVACVNSPTSVTVSGDEPGLEELGTTLKQKNIFARKLKVSIAYHSHQMKAVADAYLKALVDIKPRIVSPTAPKMFSSVFGGKTVTGQDLGSDYWVANLLSPVLFSHAIGEMVRPKGEKDEAMGSAVDLLLEIGPHEALRGPAVQTIQSHLYPNLDYVSVLSRFCNGIETALALAGHLMCRGVPVDLAAVNGDTRSRIYRSPKMLTDLPAYPWNHNITYWSESRISQEKRSRGRPPVGLIGGPMPKLVPNEHHWRGILRVADVPWLCEHKIQSSIAMPTGAFLGMAVEAIKQLRTNHKTLMTHYTLCDIEFSSTMVINEDSLIEHIVRLLRHSNTSTDKTINKVTWWSFTIAASSKTDIPLETICSGLVAVEYENEIYDAILEKENSKVPHMHSEYILAAETCNKAQNTDTFYQQLGAVGLEYGPQLQTLRDIRHNGQGRGCAVIEVSSEDCANVAQSFGLLPKTLESMVQLVYAAFGGNATGFKRGFMVTRIEELVLQEANHSSPRTQFHSLADTHRHGFRELTADVVVVSAENKLPNIKIKGLVCIETPTASLSGSQTAAIRDGYGAMLSKAIWKPAIDLLSPDEQLSFLQGQAPGHDVGMNTHIIQESSAYFVLAEALRLVRSQRLPNMKFRNALKWISHRLQEAASEKTYQGSHVLSLDEMGRAHKLGEMLRGNLELEALQNSFSGTEGQLSSLPTLKTSMAKAYQLANLAAHSNPTLSVLEIGHGYCVSSNCSLLLFKDIPTTVRYTYASTSTRNLAEANEFLAESRFEYHTRSLDLDMQLSDQDIQLHSFDMIIGCNVLSNAEDANQVLENIKALLKPGGKVSLVELTAPDPTSLPILAMANDWWRRRVDGRRRPLTPKDIEDMLCRKEFGIEIATTDSPASQFGRSNFTLASLPHVSLREQPALSHDIMILIAATASEETQGLAAKLGNCLTRSAITAWNTNLEFQNKRVISLLEMEHAFLDKLSESDFISLKRLVVEAYSIQWVTAIPEPHASTILGLARVARWEVPTSEFKTLTLDPQSAIDSEHVVAQICRVHSTASRDMEFKEIGSIICIPRIDIDVKNNKEVMRLTLDEDIDMLPLGFEPMKLSIRSPGTLSSLCFEGDETFSTELQDDEVEIQVMASNLSMQDVHITTGQVPGTSLGLEASGRITQLGSAVPSLEVGDEICMISLGAHRTSLRSKAALCHKIPTGMSFSDAATLPVAYSTTYHALFNVARMSKGQAILIHGASANASGRAAIELSQYLGLRIFATTESQEIMRALQHDYNIADGHVFLTTGSNFIKAILQATSGSGVDCVLRLVGNRDANSPLQCLSAFGIFIDLRQKADYRVLPLNVHSKPNAIFTMVSLEEMLMKVPQLLGRVLQDTFKLLIHMKAKPRLSPEVFHISNAADAIQAIQSKNYRNSMVLLHSTDRIIPFLHSPKSSLKLPADKSYVIAGGLGGLGRSVANLLVSSGARYIALISRSGVKSKVQRLFVDKLTEQDVQVRVYKCDIGDAHALGLTLAEIGETMPPVKGIVHSAVVYRDAIIHNLNYDQWHEVMQSKLHGSWNLHELSMSYNLDFFLCLGSFMGIIGGLSQSNYAAGGTFQDGLATHRRNLGLPSSTIDLGIVKGIGALEELGAVGHTAEWRDPFGVDENAVHALIRRAILGQLTNPEPHMINSIPTRAMVLDAGITEPYYFDDPRFSIMAARGSNSSSGGGVLPTSTKTPLKQQLATAPTATEASQLIMEATRTKLVKMMQAKSEEIDIGRSLHTYGIDSLLAIDFVTWAKREVNADITVFDVMAPVPIVAFVGLLTKKSKWANKG